MQDRMVRVRRNGFPVTMIVPDRAISGPVSRSWSFVSFAYTGETDKKSIAAGRGSVAHRSMFAMLEWNERADFTKSARRDEL